MSEKKEKPASIPIGRTGFKIDDDGDVTYHVEQYAIPREDFNAITLYQIHLSLLTLALGSVPEGKIIHTEH